MKENCIIHLSSQTPLVTAAIHNGHKLSEHLVKLTALSDSERFREEDPFTEVWGNISKNHIIGQRSRFEFDLNRQAEKAIYLTPSDAWGLDLWKKAPSGKILDDTLQKYYEIYERIHDGFTSLIEKHGKIVVLDFHSYNHRRGGPNAGPDDPSLNPEINIGTGTMDREYWGPLVDGFIDELKNSEILGRKLDVRENVKFKGGYFPKWIHENFKGSACCISVEAKKFFMDEWTGKPDWDLIVAIHNIFSDATPGLIAEISKMR